jgi:prepilin-type processing-associated H-X9-DG protein
MRGFRTKTMAQLFVAAMEQWTRRALGEPMPDFHAWCLARGLLGTAAEQFEPVSVEPKAATGPDFTNGATVTFVDGSVAVRDLDEVRLGRPADWRALPPLPEDAVRQSQGGA